MALITGCTLGLGGLGTPKDDASSRAPIEDDAAPVDTSHGDDGSPPAQPGSDPDGAAPGPDRPDAAIVDADAAHDGPTMPAACADAAGPCVVVPSGWSLVAFAPAQTSPCPSGFDTAPSQDLLEGPSATAACGCGACTVTQQPSCASGAIDVTYDMDFSGTCNTVAMPSPLGNTPAGACGTDIYQGIYVNYDVHYAAPPPSGGTCTAPGVQKSNGVTFASKDRVCQLNDPQAAKCAGGVCQPTVAGPYLACIAAPGAVACPPGALAVPHQAGTSGSVSCANCACSVTGTCSGTLTLYTDTACKKSPYAVSTGVCVGISSAARFTAYQYTADAPTKVGCQAIAGASPQNVVLAGEQTICCAQ